jgi:hypothetical protein
MKISFSKVCLLSAGFVAMASLASATNIDCAGPGGNQVTVPDVTLLAPNTCSVIDSSFIFSNFTVSPSGGVAGATVGIASPNDGTEVDGSGNTDLVFQISGAGSGNGDILLEYVVSGALLDGLDMNLQATPVGTAGGSVEVSEVGCSAAFVGGACTATSYGNFSVTSTCTAGSVPACNDDINSIVFAGGPESLVYIKKDITFSNATVSEFENSQDPGSAVPEPVTVSLMGMGLLTLGLLGRRLRK